MDPSYDRYTDAHVRATPQLTAKAVAYAQNYTGDFSFIIDCRNRLRAGQSLTVAQARGVLNAMRADPNVSGLPAPAAADARSQPDKIPTLTLRREETRQSQRPSFFDLPVKWRCEFGMSTHVRAEVIHIFAANKSYIRYYPHMIQRRFHLRFFPTISWLCSADVSGHRDGYPNVRLLTRDEAAELLNSGARRSCPKCQRIAALT